MTEDQKQLLLKLIKPPSWQADESALTDTEKVEAATLLRSDPDAREFIRLVAEQIDQIAEAYQINVFGFDSDRIADSDEDWDGEWNSEAPKPYTRRQILEFAGGAAVGLLVLGVLFSLIF